MSNDTMNLDIDIITSNDAFLRLDEKSKEKILTFINNTLNSKYNSIIFYGKGNNGKTTLINLIKEYLTDNWIKYYNTYDKNKLKGEYLLITNDEIYNTMVKDDVFNLVKTNSVFFETNSIKDFDDEMLNYVIEFTHKY